MTRLAAQKWWWLVVICMVSVVPVLAQAQVLTAAALPAYEVVSVKPNKTGSGNMQNRFTMDAYSATNISLPMLIMGAWRLKTDHQLSGLPGWASTATFDIEAKMDPDLVAASKKLTPEERGVQLSLLMQSLLADRFGLKLHHETKEMQSYALVIAKGGTKLHEADPKNTYANGIKGPDGKSMAGMFMVGNGQITAQAIAISTLTNNLAFQVDRQVIDQTGLKGKYDISLRYQDPQGDGGKPQDGSEANPAPSIFTALQEQLGLKLESIKGPVDTIVVDHVEMPSEN